ncbi:MAG: hypothetical protein AVDCRST_MAG05-2939, partial [uncultured Rubrobacteraceae bacterium]
GQRTWSLRGENTGPERVRGEPPLRREGEGGAGVRRRHHPLRPRRRRRTVRPGAGLLRRGGARGAHGDHRLGELVEQVQPRPARPLAGALGTGPLEGNAL